MLTLLVSYTQYNKVLNDNVHKDDLPEKPHDFNHAHITGSETSLCAKAFPLIDLRQLNFICFTGKILHLIIVLFCEC